MGVFIVSEQLQDFIVMIEGPCHANYGSYDDAKHEKLEADLDDLEQKVFDVLEENANNVPEDRKLRKLAQLLRGLAQVMAQKHNFRQSPGIAPRGTILFKH